MATFFSGLNYSLPTLPTVAGDEGVGEVVEIGKLVGAVKCGDRVILASRLKGTWRVYGIYGERDLHVISPILPLAEAAMIAVAPCSAYRLIKDFKKMHPGETIVQNAANSPVGQSVVQLCKAWDIHTINIVSSHCGFESVKENLLKLGATLVYTLDEAEQISTYHTSVSRPKLALNCLGGRYEDLMLKMIDDDGVVVYYGSAFDLPLTKEFLRCDATFCKFHLNEWDHLAPSIEKSKMLTEIVQLSAIGRFKAPVYEPVELKNYIHAIRNTVKNEAFANKCYVFDFTLP